MMRPLHARARPADMRLTAFIVLLVLMLVAAATVVVVRETAAAAQQDGQTTEERGDSDGVGEDGGWGAADLSTDAKSVVLSVDGRTFTRVTNAETVKDLLMQMGIVLDDGYAVSHDLGAEVVPGSRIVIARIEEESVTEETEVPFETTEIEDASLAQGARVVQTSGRPGIAITTFLVRYADGIEVLRTEVLSAVQQEPRTEVVRVGAGGAATPATPSAPEPTVQAPPIAVPPVEPAPAPTTPEPTQKPKPTTESTQKPTVEPTVEPEPEPEPTQKPSTKPTQKPKPEPTAKPTPKPEPTAKPTPKPEPTQKPTVEPEPEPEPTKTTPATEPDVGGGVGPGTTPSSAKALAKNMAAARGWNSDQFSCLEKLWQRESSWNYKAKNPYSTARGIPQAMMSIHFGQDWRTSSRAREYLETPSIQIDWGLNYIKRHKNFSNPCGALAFSDKHGWY